MQSCDVYLLSFSKNSTEKSAVSFSILLWISFSRLTVSFSILSIPFSRLTIVECVCRLFRRCLCAAFNILHESNINSRILSLQCWTPSFLPSVSLIINKIAIINAIAVYWMLNCYFGEETNKKMRRKKQTNC